ncbi:ras association domain-containing protein 8-like [Seriola lalandi dorsalis]|uniref:Ras association domain family member 7a n=1 Tax=Seriola lalandi dorsalis TaxID=1841481 RepID=A0A3B4XI95_SERLL|nr:ras association domain-containing protein 8-like [Seriola lalandi dorsalis]XP_023271294.1 ras association domain-containing protein 8-like [Seriola lalandi dorsalis]XP_023271295.1 ras association domain-containing protein 8-like [Seriola lalandi dorsalis]XP_056243724.1 ras association domain-containing protein 8 [Seriola aureovittata]XP_056243725.1 ras association domain-containing protein 8 [Seriola aureovittata]XP_056243726.1 ras association domain-containing protein 8 [Seriola aureovitta
MELKVWVDGVVRVVCGLSEETSCQDVVIALAQAIGQTGRYVLIQRLRDTERQLLATERPLESLAKLGQHGSEVQFFLRRTGPSSSDGPGAKQDRPTPPPLPKHPEPESSKRSQPKKALTFNLGPSTSPRTKAKQFKRSPRDSPEQRASPSPSPSPVSPHVPSPSPSPPIGPSKDEVFRKVLQQQERLRAIEGQLEALERDSHTWDRPYPSPCPSPVSDTRLQEEMDTLEQVMRRNQAELAHEQYWEEELQAEGENERGMRRKLGELHAKLDDCGRRLHEFSVRSAQLEQEIQRESQAEGRTNGPEESLDVVKAELQSQERQGTELEEQLSETDKALGKAESLLQAKQEELEELNKELRQCNLQQFIQQTGVLPAHTHSRTELQEQLEQLELAHLLQDGYTNGSHSVTLVESPPRPTAKQFLGHPRNLQNPLVSSLNPEVLTSRESSWR